MPSESLPPFFNMSCTEKGDQFSTEYFLWQDQTFRLLNQRITEFGVNVPSFSSTEVTAFPANVPVGTIWFNNTLDKLQFKGLVGVQTIQSV